MEDLAFLILCIPGLCVSALIGLLIGRARGRGGDGFVWGLLLGPIGWLVVALGPDGRAKCPFCGGALVDLKVSHCRHCGQKIARKLSDRERMLPSLETPQGDAVDQWEEKQKRKGPVSPLPVPEHLKNRRVDE